MEKELAQVAYSGDYKDLTNKPTPEELMKNIVINDLVFKDDLKKYFLENQADLIFKSTIKKINIDNYPDISFRFGRKNSFFIENDKLIEDIFQALLNLQRVLLYDKAGHYWTINNYQFFMDYKILKIVDITENFFDLLELFSNNFISLNNNYCQDFLNFIENKINFHTKIIYMILDSSDPNNLIGYYFTREKE